MTTQTASAGSTNRLSHDALFYGSDQEFADRLVPFVRDGLAAGDAVIAAVTRSNIELLREALDGAAEVSFIDRDDWYRRPAATVAGWRRLLNEATGRGHGRVRLIGEVAFGSPDRHVTWTRYESALNRLFTDAPAWIVCPYDTRALPMDVLGDARRTHPTVIDEVRRGSDHYEPPERFLRTRPEPLPPVSGPPLVEMTLRGATDIAAAREALQAILRDWPGDRIGDAVLAVNEIAANSLMHGQGKPTLRAWAEGRVLVCEICDDGPGPADLVAGYAPPAGDPPDRGWGLWIANQLCDALAIDSHHGTTRVRLALSGAAG